MTEDDVKWIVNDLGELGVEVNGRCFFLYKGESYEYGKDGLAKNGVCVHDDGRPMHYRQVGKREFGETCHPIGCLKAAIDEVRIYDCTPKRYNKRGEDTWKPLPQAPNAKLNGAEQLGEASV